MIKGLYRKLFFGKGNSMNIQTLGQNGTVHVNKGEDKSLMDITSVADVSPHHFTYQSFENTTPLERSLET